MHEAFHPSSGGNVEENYLHPPPNLLFERGYYSDIVIKNQKQGIFHNVSEVYITYIYKVIFLFIKTIL